VWPTPASIPSMWRRPSTWDYPLCSLSVAYWSRLHSEWYTGKLEYPAIQWNEPLHTLHPYRSESPARVFNVKSLWIEEVLNNEKQHFWGNNFYAPLVSEVHKHWISAHPQTHVQQFVRSSSCFISDTCRKASYKCLRWSRNNSLQIVEGKSKVTKLPVKAKEQMIDALLPPLDLGKLSSALTPMQHQRSTSAVNAWYITQGIKCYLNLQIHLHSKDGSLSYSRIHLYSWFLNRKQVELLGFKTYAPDAYILSQKLRKHRKQWSIQTDCEATTSHQLDSSSHLRSDIFLWPTIIVWERKSRLAQVLGGTRLMFADLQRWMCTHQSWTSISPPWN
jgi:hypothetical protein